MFLLGLFVHLKGRSVPRLTFDSKAPCAEYFRDKTACRSIPCSLPSSTRPVFENSDGDARISPPIFCVVSQIMQQLEGWADKFKGNYELRFLGRAVVVVSDLSDIRRMLLSRPLKFQRGLMPVSFV